MYERDAYSRAGDSGRWQTFPSDQDTSPESGRVIGFVTFDFERQTVSYERVFGSDSNRVLGSDQEPASTPKERE